MGLFASPFIMHRWRGRFYNAVAVSTATTKRVPEGTLVDIAYYPAGRMIFEKIRGYVVEPAVGILLLARPELGIEFTRCQASRTLHFDDLARALVVSIYHGNGDAVPGCNDAVAGVHI